MFHDPRQGAQDQNPTDRRRGPTPVGVHPRAHQREAENRQQTSEKRPLRRQPALKHPAHQRAHQPRAEPDPVPGMGPNNFGNGQQKGRRNGIDGRVGGLVKNIYRLKVLPERMRGIRQPAGSERVRQQQIPEFIRYQRARHAQRRQQGGANNQRQSAHQQDGLRPVIGELRECPLQPPQPFPLESRRRQAGQYAQRRRDGLSDILPSCVQEPRSKGGQGALIVRAGLKGVQRQRRQVNHCEQSCARGQPQRTPDPQWTGIPPLRDRFDSNSSCR